MGIVMRKVFFLFGLTAFLVQPTFGTTTISLMNMGKLAEKCTSGDANDNVVCDAYIAGAVDALGNVWGQGIGSKAVNENARCLSEKRFELSQARAAVMKALDSAKNNPVRDVPAVHSVIAAVTVYLCSPENDPKNRHRQPFLGRRIWFRNSIDTSPAACSLPCTLGARFAQRQILTVSKGRALK